MTRKTESNGSLHRIKQFKFLFSAWSCIFKETTIAIFLGGGCLFSTLFAPFLASLTLYSYSSWTPHKFIIYAWYGAIGGIPLSIVSGVVLGVVNGLIIVAINYFIQEDNYNHYKNMTLSIGLSVGLIAAPVLLLLMGFDLRQIDHKANIFIAVLVVVTVLANRWAVVRYLAWYKNRVSVTDQGITKDNNFE